MKTLVSLFVFFSIGISSIAQTLEYEMDKLSDGTRLFDATRIYDLGKLGAVIVDVGYDKTINLVRLDTMGNKVWVKEVDVHTKKDFCTSFFVASSTGEDLYIISSDKMQTNGGMNGIAVTDVSMKDGEATSKFSEFKDFGNPFTLYANSKYLFVVTTPQTVDICSGDESCGAKLFRIPKDGLGIEPLVSDIAIISKKHNIHWQFINVTDTYAEAYIVKEVVEQTITMELARFDNDGKKTSSKDLVINLTKEFPRKANSLMPAPRGIDMANNATNIVIPQSALSAQDHHSVIEPMAYCYLLYDNVQKKYFAFGITGPAEEKKIATPNDGFFVATFNSNFELANLSQNVGLAKLKASKSFNINATPESRCITAYLGKGHILYFSICALKDNFFYAFDTYENKIDQGTVLEGTLGQRMAGWPPATFWGGVFRPLQGSLMDDTDYFSTITHAGRASYFCSMTIEITVWQEFSSTNATIRVKRNLK